MCLIEECGARAQVHRHDADLLGASWPRDWPARSSTAYHQFYWIRFLIGVSEVSEGGFFPGVIVYLSHWYKVGGSRQQAVGPFRAGYSDVQHARRGRLRDT